jgi:hypothetical protein
MPVRLGTDGERTAEGASSSRQSRDLSANALGQRVSTLLSQPARLPLHIAGNPGALHVTELLQLPYLRRKNETGQKKIVKKTKKC